MSFFVNAIFLSIMETSNGKIYSFLILAGFCAIAWAFTYFYVPETAGKSIEENIYNIIGDSLFPENPGQEYEEYE